MSERATDWFWATGTFVHSASQVIDCGCGITYFAREPDWEKGEFEKWQARAKAEPAKYVETEDYSRWIDLDGFGVIVEDCPCDRAARAEALIWDNRRDIMTYFTSRLTDEKKRKDEEAGAATALGALHEAVDG